MNDLTLAINDIAKKDVRDRHSLFQLDHFVIGKEPSIQMKLRRCVLELKARSESIDAIKLEIDDVRDRIREIEILGSQPISSYVKIEENELSEIAKRSSSRKRISLERSLNTLDTKLKNTEEEAEFFVNTFKKLEKIEKLKSFDDPEVHSQYWNEKLSNEVAIRNFVGLPLDVELVKTILALDHNAPIKKKMLEMFDKVMIHHKKDALELEKE